MLQQLPSSLRNVSWEWASEQTQLRTSQRIMKTRPKCRKEVVVQLHQAALIMLGSHSHRRLTIKHSPTSHQACSFSQQSLVQQAAFRHQSSQTRSSVRQPCKPSFQIDQSHQWPRHLWASNQPSKLEPRFSRKSKPNKSLPLRNKRRLNGSLVSTQKYTSSSEPRRTTYTGRASAGTSQSFVTSSRRIKFRLLPESTRDDPP